MKTKEQIQNRILSWNTFLDENYSRQMFESLEKMVEACIEELEWVLKDNNDD